MPNLENLEEVYRGSMLEHLGIRFLSCEEGRVVSEMAVDHRTMQPFRVLNGGATLALAEMTAGHGTYMLCEEGDQPCGMQVSGNHVSSAPVGTNVIATATMLHRGRTTHVWNVDVTTPEGKLVSTVRVVNFIMKKG